MNKKLTLGLTFALIAILGISGFAAAQGWFGNGMAKTEEQREAMQQAVQNKDYSAWKSLMQERFVQMQSQITEENFNAMVDRHTKMQEFRLAMQEARESGDFSKVEELREQYGMESQGKGNGRGMGLGQGKGMHSGNCMSK